MLSEKNNLQKNSVLDRCNLCPSGLILTAVKNSQIILGILKIKQFDV